MRRPSCVAAVVGSLVISIALAGSSTPAFAAGPGAPPVCETAGGDAGAQRALMRRYADSRRPTARQADERGTGRPESVLVEIPPIAFDGPGQSPSLPVGPCQTIYRFAFPRIQAPRRAAESPFAYAEVDWNTEGIPRGPNGSFASPHFDFHFYLDSRRDVDHHTMCRSSNGRTCDPQLTSYAQMRRFLDLPGPGFIPADYFPDTGSSIPLMGLHLLDGRATYTLDAVNHHPTLIYGTFDGRVFFAEASVTLYTLQDAMAAPDHEVVFRYRSPRRVQGGGVWPTRFVVRWVEATGGFVAGFERFR